MDLHACTLCPRACGADRTAGPGLCGAGELPRLARAALHRWEEPCVSGTRGSGAVFFSGCPLGCCFCQNRAISSGNRGAEVSPERLEEIFLELQDQGAHNLNLVSAGQYLPQVARVLGRVRGRLRIPVVYNTGGYERAEALRQLDGLVDVYLPDLKFYDSALAARYAAAPDYFPVAAAAIGEMLRQTGPVELDEEGLIRRGVMVRHLVLPGGRGDSEQILRWMAGHLPLSDIRLSLMWQYTPDADSPHKELRRRVATGEYRPLAELAAELGFQGYLQERSSARESYTPAFDLEGVLRRASGGPAAEDAAPLSHDSPGDLSMRTLF